MHPFFIGPYLEAPFICPQETLEGGGDGVVMEGSGIYDTAQSCYDNCKYNDNFNFEFNQKHPCIGTPKTIDGIQLGNNPNKSFTYQHPDNGETTVEGLNYFDNHCVKIKE